ncbi:HIT domain-containing protein [Nocardioides rotundus]|uniref:HIT family protein n=1 Tax=Nocardioides rotundus TaxID=1774216 RepID=UPI001CBC061B|nr:HIT domain-containing protein [Nocardioides rotundus]UAL29085.1 HIT domain-containing protein [Nocardioides rotundus]
MTDCLFCRIVAGEEPAARVLARDGFTAFLDVRPVFKGHVLLVPDEHVVTLPDLPAAERDPFLALGQQLCTAMVEELGAQGLVNCTLSGGSSWEIPGAGKAAA